jgi:hypothetical protein
MLNMLANGGTPPYNYELNGPGGFNYFMQNTNGIQSVNPLFLEYIIFMQLILLDVLAML